MEFRNDISDVFQACYFTNTNGNSLYKGCFINSIMHCMNEFNHAEAGEKQGKFGEDFVNKLKANHLFIRGFFN